MKTITIQSLEQYLAQFDTLEETEFYRGVGNERDFKLIPSAGRFGIQDLKAQAEFEQQMLRDFKRSAPQFTNIKPQSDFEWLFLAQHHGLPTRLLDWTYNPLVALHFAIENDINTDAAVYCSYPSRAITPDVMHTWKDPFSIQDLMEVIPTHEHVRYKNQNGLFTIHCNPNSENLSKVTRKIVIPQGYRNSMRWKLRKIGITKALLFSDLDSLAYDVQKISESKYAPYIQEG